MARRKGMGKGKGRGYKNIIGKDPKVHSQSARGIKQPQRIPIITPIRENDILKQKKFKSRVVRETAYGIVDDYGVVENTMTLRQGKNNLYIEWEVGKDGEIDYTEIGVWTAGRKVTDVDGVFELPKQARQLLKDYGLDLSEIERYE